MDFGFVVLSPDGNIGRIKSTLTSIENYYGKVPVVCSISPNINKDSINEINKLCKTVQASHSTNMSLLNAGLEGSDECWNLIVNEGSWIRKNIFRKYSLFIKSEKDIFFPISAEYDHQGKPMRLHVKFADSHNNGKFINGIMIHKKTFNEVGKFSDNPMGVSLHMWGLQAQDLGFRMKGILVKIC